MGEVSSTDTTDYITKNELPLPLTLIRVARLLFSPASLQCVCGVGGGRKICVCILLRREASDVRSFFMELYTWGVYDMATGNSVEFNKDLYIYKRLVRTSSISPS